jgi:hypothetical protein
MFAQATLHRAENISSLICSPQSSTRVRRASLQVQIGPLPSSHVSQPQSAGPLLDSSPRRRILHVPASQEKRPPMRAEDPEHIVPVLEHSRANGPFPWDPHVEEIDITNDIVVDGLCTGLTYLAGTV